MSSTYGLLINKEDILLQRSYFNELVTMLGVQVLDEFVQTKLYSFRTRVASC